MTYIVIVPKLPKNKKKRKKWLFKTFGSGVVDSGMVLFIEQNE